MLFTETGAVGCVKRYLLHKVTLHYTDVSVNQSTIRMSVVKSRLVPAHHVQAATVYQGSELMQTNLCGVQYPLDLFQTLLKVEEKIRTKKFTAAYLKYTSGPRFCFDTGN